VVCSGLVERREGVGWTAIASVVEGEPRHPRLSILEGLIVPYVGPNGIELVLHDGETSPSALSEHMQMRHMASSLGTSSFFSAASLAKRRALRRAAFCGNGAARGCVISCALLSVLSPLLPPEARFCSLFQDFVRIACANPSIKESEDGAARLGCCS